MPMDPWSDSQTHRFLLALQDVWEDPPLPKADHDHPVYISPDWPPPCELDQAIYRIIHDSHQSKVLRLSSIFVHHGYSKREAYVLANDLVPSAD
jgi:hypothetical protein